MDWSWIHRTKLVYSFVYDLPRGFLLKRAPCGGAAPDCSCAAPGRSTVACRLSVSCCLSTALTYLEMVLYEAKVPVDKCPEKQKPTVRQKRHFGTRDCHFPSTSRASRIWPCKIERRDSSTKDETHPQQPSLYKSRWCRSPPAAIAAASALPPLCISWVFTSSE